METCKREVQMQEGRQVVDASCRTIHRSFLTCSPLLHQCKQQMHACQDAGTCEA